MKRIDKHEFTNMVYDKVKGKGSWESTYWTVKAVFECMADVIENGDSLYIREYLTLYPKLKKDRVTGNFGNPCIIPEHYVPCFKSNKILKEACEQLKKNEEQEKGNKK